MTRTVTRTSLIVFASIFMLAAVANAEARHDHECSNASLQGTYGFYSTATIVPAGTPRVAVSLMTFDGGGHWSNSQTANNNGAVTHVTLPGQIYVVSSDCTGTFFDAAGRKLGEIVLVDDAKEFYFIRTDPPVLVLYGVGKKQFPDHEDHDGR